MGNLSSKTLKCHISVIIYCKTHVCHVPSVVNDLRPVMSNLRSSENSPAYEGWGRYKSNCKFLPRWFRYSLSWSFLRSSNLRSGSIFISLWKLHENRSNWAWSQVNDLVVVPILYLPTLSQMREIFTLPWSWLRLIPETSRRLPKISDEFPNTSKPCRKLNVRRCYENVWALPKLLKRWQF